MNDDLIKRAFPVAVSKPTANLKLKAILQAIDARRANMPAVDLGDSVKAIHDLRAGGQHARTTEATRHADQ